MRGSDLGKFQDVGRYTGSVENLLAVFRVGALLAKSLSEWATKGLRLDDQFQGQSLPEGRDLVCCVFYVRYSTSYRDLEEILAERGVDADHATRNRWGVKYALLIAAEIQKRKSPAGRSWRMVETYIKVKGRWCYMISGEGTRSGVLSMGPAPAPGRILIASLLGATLVGMRMLQKVPLLRDGGQIETIVVVDVSPAPDHDAA